MECFTAEKRSKSVWRTRFADGSAGQISLTRSPMRSSCGRMKLITVEIARKIEEMGLERIQVRSPMACEAELGICRLLLRNGFVDGIARSRKDWRWASSRHSPSASPVRS